jgi:4-hydroxythreonine-4-phosphate dehydrogenase
MAKKKIAVTIGDPSGIGPEIVIKSLNKYPKIYNHCTPIVFGDIAILNHHAEVLEIETKFEQIDDLDSTIKPSPEQIYTYSAHKNKEVPKFGSVNPTAGKYAFQYIEAAIRAAQANEIDAIATAPINKEALRIAGVPYLDHTEILTQLTNSTNTMTLFMAGTLRVFFYSRHIAFKDISAALDKGKLVDTLSLCHTYLEQIGIKSPKIALAALNPHGGEQGMFGREEIEVLEPAVNHAREEGINVEGPVSADSVFHLGIEGVYDGILSLYHDQGHIAAKTYDFYKTVSLTMGLPFLRTSVDHGTAMEMAGKNRANETSMFEAILAAAKYAW